MMATTRSTVDDWEFVVKLDGDLTFPPDYFEKCFEHFEQEPQLGVGGGEIYHDLGESRNSKPIRSSMSEERPRSIEGPAGKRLAVYCKLRAGTELMK